MYVGNYIVLLILSVTLNSFFNSSKSCVVLVNFKLKVDCSSTPTFKDSVNSWSFVNKS